MRLELTPTTVQVHLTLADGPGRLRELTIAHRDPESVVAELERGARAGP
jgi:hypothetical protein